MAIEITTANEEQLSDIRQALGVATTKEIFPEATLGFNGNDGSIAIVLANKMGTIVNFKPLGSCALIVMPFGGQNKPLSAISGTEYLTQLEDRGTENSLYLNQCNFTAATLNQFFTDLPAITNGRTATINVTNNPGTATCNPSIATAKGYTIVTE